MPVDVMHRFQLGDTGIHGVFVQMESSWAAMRAHVDYPEPVAGLLGTTVAAAALFTGLVKFEGKLSIQLRGTGDLRLLFAEATHAGTVRGIARWEGGPPRSLADAGDDAQLAITIENAQRQTRQQGLVAVDGEHLAAALEQYFERSEQLPTRIVLAAGGGRCAGLLLQRAPAEGGHAASGDADAWNRAGHLLSTLRDEELLGLSVETVLTRLFHEEGVRLQAGRALEFACSCSAERVAGVLRSLGEEESRAAAGPEGVVEVTCEFCGHAYRFDAVDVAAMFAGDGVMSGSGTRQ
ncbi:Hsp33 family molecular chaperone HslO [Dokdonella sp. MW10]|uniref:Hsp33 family molecular chaperone HslO n=1 Tax=Dokdonella sp. MW10 TaxID=2992926 RepID=UPI003F81A2AC